MITSYRVVHDARSYDRLDKVQWTTSHVGPVMANTLGGEVAVYEAADGQVRVDVKLREGTVWLTQRQIAELFDTITENVLTHLDNIFRDGELAKAATAKDFLVVQAEGRRWVRRNLAQSEGTARGVLSAHAGTRGRPAFNLAFSRDLDLHSAASEPFT